MFMCPSSISYENPDKTSAVTYDDKNDPHAQAAGLVHEIGLEWGERRGMWEGGITGALIGLILGIVLTLAFFPGWVC